MATNVLIAVSSQHGETREIGERIAQVFRAKGLDVTVSNTDEVLSVSPFGALVFGGAVYGGGWLPQAVEFIKRYPKIAKFRKVWAFSAGPLGPDRIPVETGPILAVQQATELGATEHKVFTGSLNKGAVSNDQLTIGSKSTPDGDYRDWSEIEAWAEHIADQLN